MVEREPLTVVCSEMGWIRAMRGHLPPDGELKFKDGDGPRFFLHAETTDRLLGLRLERTDVHAGLPRRCRAGAAWASRCG